MLAMAGCHRRSGSGAGFFEDLSFGGNAFDFYKQGTKRAALIVIHGGGWTSGAKEGVTATAEAFRDLGWPVFNINYTLDPADPQTPIDEVMSFVAHVRDNEQTYNIDGAKVGIVGLSAGGHLGLMAACTGVDGDTMPDVVCAWSPPCRLSTLTSSGATAAQNYMNVALAGNEAAWAAKSPYSVVTSDCPPIRLVINDNENLDNGGLGEDQATDMETAALAVSVDVEALVKVGTSHPVSDSALTHAWLQTKLGVSW